MFRFLHKKKPLPKVEFFDSGFLLKKEDLEDFMYKWNIQFPIDRWYREKYKLRFGSDEHRRVKILDISFEYLEDQAYLKAQKQYEYTPNEGKFLRTRKKEEKLTLEEVEREFKNIDLSKFDDV